LAKYYAEHGVPGEAPADLSAEEAAAVDEEVSGRTKRPGKVAAKKSAAKKAATAGPRGPRKKSGSTKVDEEAAVAAKAERARRAAARR